MEEVPARIGKKSNKMGTTAGESSVLGSATSSCVQKLQPQSKSVPPPPHPPPQTASTPARSPPPPPPPPRPPPTAQHPEEEWVKPRPPPPPGPPPQNADEAIPPPQEEPRRYKAPPNFAKRPVPPPPAPAPPTKALPTRTPPQPYAPQDGQQRLHAPTAAEPRPEPPPAPPLPASVDYVLPLTEPTADPLEVEAETSEEVRAPDVLDQDVLDEIASLCTDVVTSGQPQRLDEETPAGSDTPDAVEHHAEDSQCSPMGSEEVVQVEATPLPEAVQRDTPTRQWLQSSDSELPTEQTKTVEDMQSAEVHVHEARDVIDQSMARKAAGGSKSSTLLPAWIVTTQKTLGATRTVAEESCAKEAPNEGEGPNNEVQEESITRTARLFQERPGILAADAQCNALRDGCLEWGSTPTPSSSSRPSRSVLPPYSLRFPTLAASMHPQNGQRFQGTVAYYHHEKGYGFIRSEDVESKIYVHCSDFVDPMAPRQLNSKVEFTLKNPGEKQRALDVKIICIGSGCPPQPVGRQTVAFADGMPLTGRIRAFRQEKGFGFISTQQLDADVFFSASEIVGEQPGELQAAPGTEARGPEVSFTVWQATKGPKAMDVRITGPALEEPEEGQQQKIKSSNKHWQWNQASGWRSGWNDRQSSPSAAEATPKGALLLGIEQALSHRHQFVMKRGDGYVWLASVLHQGAFKDVPGLPLPDCPANGVLGDEVMSLVREALSDPWLKGPAARLELWDDGKNAPWIRQRKQAGWNRNGWSQGNAGYSEQHSASHVEAVPEPVPALQEPAVEQRSTKDEVFAESTSWWQGDPLPSQLSKQTDQADAGAGVPASPGCTDAAAAEDSHVDPWSIQDPWLGKVEVKSATHLVADSVELPLGTIAALESEVAEEERFTQGSPPEAAAATEEQVEASDPQAAAACEDEVAAEEEQLEGRFDTCENA